MSNRPRFLALVLFVALLMAMAGAGCGGDDDESAGTEGTTEPTVAAESGSDKKSSPQSEPGSAQKPSEDESPEQTEGVDSATDQGSGGADADNPDASTGNADGKKGSRSSRGDQTSTTKFVATADAICKGEGDRITKALEERVAGKVDSVGKEGIADELVNELWAPMLEAEIAKLEALGASGAAATGLDLIIAEMEKVIAEAKADPDAFLVTTRPFAASEQIGKQRGFKYCGGV